MRVDENLQGKRVKCPSCGNAILVNSAPDPQPNIQGGSISSPPPAPPAPHLSVQQPDSDFGFSSEVPPPARRQTRGEKKPSGNSLVLYIGGGVLMIALVAVVLWLTGVFGSGTNGSNGGGLADSDDKLPLVADGMPAHWKLVQSAVERKSLEEAVRKAAASEQKVLPALEKRGLGVLKPLRLGNKAAFTGKELIVAVDTSFNVGNSKVKVQDLSTNKVLQSFAETGNMLAAGPKILGFGQESPPQFSAKQWDPLGFEATVELKDWSYLSAVAISPDGETVAVSGIPDLLGQPPDVVKSGVLPASVLIWQPNKDKIIGKVGRFKMYENDEAQHYRAVSMSFSPDGKLLATAHAVGCVCLWEATTGNPLRIWKFIEQRPNKMPIRCSPYLSFSTDGTQIVIGVSRYKESINSYLKVIDLTNGTIRDIVTYEKSAIDDAECIPGTKYALTADRAKRMVQIWNIETGKKVTSITDVSAFDISLSPGGTLMIADGKLYDLKGSLPGR